MSDKETKNELEEATSTEINTSSTDENQWVNEFAMDEIELAPISSGDLLGSPREELADAESIKALAEPIDEIDLLEDPIFKELAMPKLPEPEKQNRARLQMQSPTKIHFYWSVKLNPFKTLSRAFSGAANYTLVAKLLNQSNGREEIFPVDAEGSWWFDVDAGSSYQAEVGFYAPNRPFVRIMFSNVLETPRKSPSSRRASESEWAISSQKFAEVLDNSGYSQDAFDVALAGDDFESSEIATQNAFSQFVGVKEKQFEDFDQDEMRFALLAIASGYSIEDLRGTIGATLFAYLQKNEEKLISENAFAALNEHFDISMEDVEIEESEFTGDPVFGASIVHFPKFTTKKRTSQKPLTPSIVGKGFKSGLSPISSLRI